MSQRLNAIVPDETYQQLLQLAEIEKRTKSQMAAILIEEAISSRKLAKTKPDGSSKDNAA